MRYAVFAGGKRLRPFLVLNCSRLFQVERAQRCGSPRQSRRSTPIRWFMTICPAWMTTICAADDPPRILPLTKRPRCLTGDGLQNWPSAFWRRGKPIRQPEIRSELVFRLARAAGHDGMVGGQMIDMEAGQSRFDFGQIVVLQRMKTGALVRILLRIGRRACRRRAGRSGAAAQLCP